MIVVAPQGAVHGQLRTLGVSVNHHTERPVGYQTGYSRNDFTKNKNSAAAGSVLNRCKESVKHSAHVAKAD